MKEGRTVSRTRHDSEPTGRQDDRAKPARRVLTVLLLAGVLLCAVGGRVMAAPAAPLAFTFVQPDGAKFEARVFGDEWFHGYETAEGYTIVRDRATGVWTFAVLDERGDLVAGPLAPGRDSPAELVKHMRPARTARPESVLRPAATNRAASRVGNTGTQKVLLILVYFTDCPPKGTNAAQWNSAFFASTDSVSHYYREVSYGSLNLAPATECYGTSGDGVVGAERVHYLHGVVRDYAGGSE